MSLRLPDALHDALRRQASVEHLSANELVVRVLTDALDARKRRRDELIAKIMERDAELLDRLAQ